MWISETKQLLCEKVWLGNGSQNTVVATINTPAGLALTEGIKIRADKANVDPILVSYTGVNANGSYHLHPAEEIYLPVTDPSLITVAAEANTVAYSFVAW